MAFAGQPGIRFTYSFTGRTRTAAQGRGRAAMIGGKLYLITFGGAPAALFRRRGGGVPQVADSAKL